MKYALCATLLLLATSAHAALTQATCDATAEPVPLRIEGLAEPAGEIVITCAGTPGGTVDGGMSLFVALPVTNRQNSDGRLLGIELTVETSTGLRTIGGQPLLTGSSGVFFDAFTFDLPASGVTSFRIRGLRVAAARGQEQRPVTAQISTSGQSGIGVRNSNVTVGIPQRSLLGNAVSGRIFCGYSPVPEDTSLFGFLNSSTTVSTMRVTEGFPSAFRPRDASSTNGTRIAVRFSGLPQGARLFVPENIAGSSAAEPTSAGDLGLARSGGRYTGGQGNSLLLSVVRNADNAGGGGNPSLPPLPAVQLILGTMVELTVSGGNAAVTYEVVDANTGVLEFAHLPVFVTLDDRNATPTVAAAELSYAPISNIAVSNESAPVPRFLATRPGADCQILRDCDAPYFPKLFVEAPSLELRYVVPQNSNGFFSNRINVRNESSGNMIWTTNIQYRDRSGWLVATPSAGVNNASVQLTVRPDGLPVGIYEATFTIDAGLAPGSRSFRVILTIVPASDPNPIPNPNPNPNPTPPALPQPRFWTVGNSANLGVNAVVPGSLVDIEGVLLLGMARTVRFDEFEARVVAAAADRLRVIAPAGLAGRTSARLVITVDGVASEAMTVPVAATAPAIFRGAVYNQDGFANSAMNPERAGNVIQVFLAGLGSPAEVTVFIHDREIRQPLYAGDAPGTPGVQQVNARIPEDLPAMESEVKVCSRAPGMEQVCTLGMPLWIQARE